MLLYYLINIHTSVAIYLFHKPYIFFIYFINWCVDLIGIQC